MAERTKVLDAQAKVLGAPDKSVGLKYKTAMGRVSQALMACQLGREQEMRDALEALPAAMNDFAIH